MYQFYWIIAVVCSLALGIFSGCKEANPLIGDKTDYFPTPPGAWWDFGSFKLTVQDTTATLINGKVVQIIKIAHAEMTNPKKKYTTELFIRKEPTELRRYLGLTDTIGVVWLKLPPRVGEKWYSNSQQAVQESTLTVPAGQFARSIKVEWLGGYAGFEESPFYWYAPGVGPIVWGREKLKNYGIKAP